MDYNELMNRRQFFKKTAREMLPMLGAFVAAPTVIMSTLTSCGKEDDSIGCPDCSSSCSSTCYSTCKGTESGNGCSDCSSSCSVSSTSSTCSSCANDCSSSCKDACKNTCSTSCEGSATGKATTGSINGHEYVDLGLSVLWATCNIGAKEFYSYGDYFAFADTHNDITGDDSEDKVVYNKLGLKEGTCISGTANDIALYKWGSDWRLPTDDEFYELIENCKLEYSYHKDEVKHDGDYYSHGLKFISKINNNTIFLPFAGCHFEKKQDEDPYECNSTGFYWSGDVTSYGNLLRAFCLLIDSDKYATPNAWVDGRNLNCFQSVRPVADRNKGNVSTCNGSCTANCSSNCTSTCKNACGKDCQNGCKDGCSTGCKTTCKGECKEKCTKTCADNCSNNCTGKCTTTCADACKAQTSQYCSNCASNCSSGCTTTCADACKAQTSQGCSNCATQCSGECKQECTYGCGGQCHVSCGGQCKGKCGASCQVECTSYAKNTPCASCGGTCRSACNENCTYDCYTTCKSIGYK